MNVELIEMGVAAILIPFIIVIAAFIIMVVLTVKRAKKKTDEIEKKGYKTDATVVRSNREEGTYVEYRGDDGVSHTALLSIGGTIPVGRRVIVKYRPPKYDYVIFVSQEL
jgi:competence protein ComGC